MSEADIHCNVIKCRRPLSLETQACVTSCSHIFCLDCSKKNFSVSLYCPACNTPLSEESDDIILTQLNPTEEYKSVNAVSVLAGLKPDIILDICSRAIAFYEYQTSQELNFRAILQKTTEEKYASLKSQFDIMARDLNHLIKVEREKQKNILNEYELEKKKSQQMYSKLEDKSKQFQKLQVMYEKLKRKSIGPNMQESFHNNNTSTTQLQPMISHTNSARNVIRFSNSRDDDIISRIGRSSTVAARSIIHSGTPLSPPIRQQSRIPSPVKSVYSVRSHQRKRYYHHHAPSPNNNAKKGYQSHKVISPAAAPPSSQL